LSRINLSSISDDDRYHMLDYVVSKYGSHALGYGRTMIYYIKSRKYRVTDQVLLKCEVEALGVLKNGVIDYGLVTEVLAYAVNDPLLKSLIIKFVLENMWHEIPYIVKVTEEHVRKFERVPLTKAPKTREDRLRYLRKALNDLNWELTPDKLKEYVLELQEVSANLA